MDLTAIMDLFEDDFCGVDAILELTGSLLLVLCLTVPAYPTGILN